MTGGLWESQEVFRGAEGPASRVVLSWALALVALIPSVMLLGGAIRPKSCWLRAMAHAVARPWWGALLVAFVVAMLISGSLTARHAPVPYIHDEFAYLLEADTFAHGRLANPVPPAWRHFETFHVLLQPTYSAKYPVGQAASLALGQVLFDAPIAGVWLAFAAACAAVAWAARAWLGPRWGLVAGLMAALHPAFHLFKPFTWSQSFWGGGVAFLGGALVLGAWRRIDRKPSVRPALILGAGLAILFVTRPWEGAVASLPVAAGLLAKFLNEPALRKHSVALVAVPVLAVLLATGTFVAVKNNAVTGSAATMPYVLYEQQYAAAPVFNFQDAPPVKWNPHPQILSYHGGWSRAIWSKQRTVSGFLTVAAFKCFLLWNFFPGAYMALVPGFFLVLRRPALAALLTVAGFVTTLLVAWLAPDYLAPAVATVVLLLGGIMLVSLTSQRMLRVSLVVVFGLIATLCTCWSQPHYVAPSAAAFFVLATACARRLACCLANRRAALWMAAAGLLASPVFLTFGGLILVSRSRPAWADERIKVVERLEQAPGKHLVIVKYAPLHNINFEWVYNSADIPSQRIVWARAMDGAADRRLMDAFPDRDVWILEPDRGVPLLQRIEGKAN